MDEIFDVHCHILPSIDDGASNLEESLEMIAMEYKDGVRNLICTPHYRKNLFDTNLDIVSKSFQNVQEKALSRWPDLKLYLGCEFHVNSEMIETIDQDERYRINGGRYVLLEFSEPDDYSFIRRKASLLQSSGYTPVIAHGERYSSLFRQMERVEELKDMGIWIQINSGSILGKEGWGVKRFCRKLLTRNLVDVIGSDCHNLRTRVSDMGECRSFLINKYGTSCARRLLIENPAKLVS